VLTNATIFPSLEIDAPPLLPFASVPDEFRELAERDR